MALDITSYEIGKKAGGGSQPVNLQDKEITITENGEQTITADSGYDGLSQVDITTNVSGGDDWSDIGYSSTPEYIQDIHAYSKQIYDNWDADNPHTFQNDTNLVICPLIDTSKMTDMSNMFYGCTSLRDVPALNTSNSTKFFRAFGNCKFTNIDVSSFDTRNVTNLNQMFGWCSNLTTINFGNNFILTNIREMYNMFIQTNKLDDNTLNQILHICTTVGNSYPSNNKKLSELGITSSFVNYANIPNLSNYQAFLDAGWTIS